MTQAATLTATRGYLDRQTAGLTSGEELAVFFTSTSNLPGVTNTVVFEFPDADDGLWCRTNGNDLQIVGLTTAAGTGETATSLPGALAGNCVAGSGGGSFDTITITGVGALVAGQHYGVDIAGGSTAKLGTANVGVGIKVNLSTTDGSSTIDTGRFDLALISNDSVSITASVISGTTPADPIVQFKGLGSPTAPISIARDGTENITLAAGADARFDTTLSAEPTGAHIYEITGTDSLGRKLAPLTFALTLTLNSTTIISGIFLGPSITVDQPTVKLGAIVTLAGMTAPSTNLTLTVHSVSAKSFTINVGSNGRWSYPVNTTDVGTGTHTATAQAVTTSNEVSATSESVSFAVNPLTACDGKKTADLNCDGAVNLTDFSILLFFWQKKNPSNARADINADGQVTIVDFSVMLFQWTAL